MGNVLRIMVILSAVFIVGGCSLIATNIVQPAAKEVRIYHDDESVSECSFVGDVVGTEGHWYNYLFITNKDLTLGALHDLKNQASKMGADSIYLSHNMHFNTSVTLLGQAYACGIKNKLK